MQESKFRTEPPEYEAGVQNANRDVSLRGHIG
jgi:hypothetical protein